MRGARGETPGRGVPRIFRRSRVSSSWLVRGIRVRKTTVDFLMLAQEVHAVFIPWFRCSRLLLERGEQYDFQGEWLEAVIMLPLREWGFLGGFIQDDSRHMPCQALCHVSCHVLSTAAKSWAPLDIAVASSGWMICNPPIDVARQHNYCGDSCR
jgi:hypothetical protein